MRCGYYSSSPPLSAISSSEKQHPYKLFSSLPHWVSWQNWINSLQSHLSHMPLPSETSSDNSSQLWITKIREKIKVGGTRQGLSEPSLHHETPQTDGLNHRNSILVVPEAGSRIAGCPRNGVWGGLSSGSHLPSVSSSYKGVDLITGPPPYGSYLNLSTGQRPPASIYHHTAGSGVSI